jgi:hypothetical protein
MRIRSGIVSAFAVALIAPLGAVQASDTATAPKADAKEKVEAKKDDAQCDTAPGSRIRQAKPADCKKMAKQPFRSYSKEELDSTGETDINEALRKLDPIFR